MKNLPELPDSNRWANLSLSEQMANIGSEVGRTRKWILLGKTDLADSAFIRALDLFDLTIKYGRSANENRGAMLKELCRCREVFAFAVTTSDKETLEFLDRYFYFFAIAARS